MKTEQDARRKQAERVLASAGRPRVAQGSNEIAKPLFAAQFRVDRRHLSGTCDIGGIHF
jgi:hypothetical protein